MFLITDVTTELEYCRYKFSSILRNSVYTDLSSFTVDNSEIINNNDQCSSVTESHAFMYSVLKIIGKACNDPFTSVA